MWGLISFTALFYKKAVYVAVALEKPFHLPYCIFQGIWLNSVSELLKQMFLISSIFVLYFLTWTTEFLVSSQWRWDANIEN